jgi:hypothetical protein
MLIVKKSEGMMTDLPTVAAPSSPRAVEDHSASVLYDAARDMLTRQIHQHEVVDAKLQTLLGVGGVVLALSIGFLANLPRSIPVFVVWSLGALVYLAALTCGLRAYHPQRYHYTQVTPALYHAAVDQSVRETQRELTLSMLTAWEQNRPLIAEKLAGLKHALWAVLAEGALIVAALALALWTR